MRSDDRTRCPTCRARFSGSATCGRCGANLARLMALLAESHRLRGEARAALRRSEVAVAGDYAREAQRLAATPAGARLVAVLDWISSSSRP